MDKKYSDVISKLLSDMETFLMSTLSEIELHTAAEVNRREILKQIEMLRHEIFPESQEYIEMNGSIPRKDKVATDVIEEHVNEYANEEAEPPKEILTCYTNSSVICNEYENENVMQHEESIVWPPSVCEEALPLGQINPPSAPALKAMAIKCGPLQRKDRFMFMDQFRRLWAGLHGHHLYFFSNDKDSKPQHVLDISEYSARPAPEATRDSKKKPLCFEVVCPKNKTQQFIARTPKDMEQWVAVIRRANMKNHLSTYDDASDSKMKSQSSQRHIQARYLSEDSEYAIYHDIQDGILPENLYDDAAGQCGAYLNFEETYDDVGGWREKVGEKTMANFLEDSVGITATTTDENGGVIGGIRLPSGGGRIRQLVRLMEEEGVIKGDECGRRKDEGGGARNVEEGKDH